MRTDVPSAATERRLAILAAQSMLGVRLDVKVNRYRIAGSTADQLRTSIGLVGPHRQGHMFGAYTDWRIAWRYERLSDEGLLGVGAFNIEAAALVTLPDWRPGRGASARLVTQWNDYMRALDEHESGHAAFALEASKRLIHAVSGIPRARDTKALDRSVELVAARILADVRLREVRWDEATQHGAVYGARL